MTAWANPLPSSPFSIAIDLNELSDCSGSKLGVFSRVGDRDVGGGESRPIGVSQQQDRFSNVPDVRDGQGRLILVDQRNDVPSRNVAVVHNVKPSRSKL